MSIKYENQKNSKTGDYWNSKGAYQAEYDILVKAFIPDSGEALTVHGELLRCATRLYYEAYNNGNCNAQDEGEQLGDWDSEDEDYEIIISKMFDGFIDFIESHCSKAEDNCDKVRNIILDDSMNSGSEYHLIAYDALIDLVVFKIMTTEDKAVKND